jgi:glycosyltransferase involved in cell wall biosynthesis
MQLVATGTNGGAQEHVAALLSGLDRRRFDVRVISLSEGSAVARWRQSGVPVEVVTAVNELRLVAEVADRVADWQTQVLHGHMFGAEVVGARAALRLDGLGLARPFVINHIHSSRRRSAQDRAMVNALDGSVDRLVAVSHAIRAKLATERPGHPQLELIPNGVDLRRFGDAQMRAPLAAEFGFPGSVPIVGCVARLEPEKGHTTLLEAWPRVLRAVPGARLLIVGEGSLGEALRLRADALGLLGRTMDDRFEGSTSSRPEARVIFTGRRDDMPAVTAALHVSVLPSHREAQGLVILEAMALARPVVATRVGGIPEMIEDGISGLLVPPGDPVAMAAAIIRVLQDQGLARRLGSAGHQLVRRRFPVERMIAQVSSLYEEGVRVWGYRTGAQTDDGGRGSGPLIADDDAEAAA